MHGLITIVWTCSLIHISLFILICFVEILHGLQCVIKASCGRTEKMWESIDAILLRNRLESINRLDPNPLIGINQLRWNIAE